MHEAGYAVARHVPRSAQKTADARNRVAELLAGDGLELEETSGVKSASELGLASVQSSSGGGAPQHAERMDASRPGRPFLADEAERTRLIADLTRLMNEPCIPETTRVAGLTLIGWLARRRLDEVPHDLGIEQARKSVGRTKACRGRAR